MAKRKGHCDEGSPHEKRRKLTKDFSAKEEVQIVQNSEDLRLLLTFEQDAGPHTRQKIQSFKLFLDSVAYGKESDERSAKQELLLDYLRSQAPLDGEENCIYLADIIKTWHFAAHSNAESLLSSVAAVLALLLKTISSLIEFREWGNRLCRTLLHNDQIKLFDRGLSANKAKEHLISPCLRLLTEVVSFDGGYAAGSVFRQREVTMKRLEIFLGVRKATQGSELQGRRRVSVRDNALKYLHANLRLQTPTARRYILAQGRIVHAWLEGIAEDTPIAILEILDVLKKDVALDSAINISTKSRVFCHWVLGRLASLYSYNETTDHPEGYRNVHKSVNDFLLFICTSPGFGVLDTYDEGYSAIDEADVTLNAWSKSNLPTSNKLHRKKQTTPRNAKLSSFLQTLRPHASVAQSKLVIAVFRKAPELVSDYFSRRKSFSFDPKATATWIGYSSFLLATVQIPLSERLKPKGVNDPIPSSYATIMDSIIPHPLTKRVMTRCVNQSTDLVKFLAIRILNAAFEKFANVLRICKDMQTCTLERRCAVAWSQTQSRLVEEFCDHIPDMECVIAQFRSCTGGNVMLQESITRLLGLYYAVLPQAALEQRLDISATLSGVLEDQNVQGEGDEERGVKLLQLEHLLLIAHRSPNMQWFHRPGNVWLSPFTMLLKVHRDRSRTYPGSQRLREVLESVAIENQVLNSCDALDALILSLQDFGVGDASDQVFEFLDNCVLRLVKKSVHYFDVLVNLVVPADDETYTIDNRLDLLLVAVMEQWPFLAKSVDQTALRSVSTWLVRYIELLRLRLKHDGKDTLQGETAGLLSTIRSQIGVVTEDRACRQMFEEAWKDPLELGVREPTIVNTAIPDEGEVATFDHWTENERQNGSVDLVPLSPPQEGTDHRGLHQWSRQNIQDAVSEGAIGELFLCLCSEYVDIRKQALGNIGAFMKKLEASGYSEWQQTFVLAGEVVETAKDSVSHAHLPYFTGVLAANLLLVIAEPLHPMYAKANKFLNRGPQWNVQKLPSYWVDKIMLNPPTEDEAYHQEVGWLLETLFGGLRTPADMEIYRHCNIFERLLSLSASPSLPQPCFGKILDMLFRCTYVQGSSMLISRCAVVSWITSHLTQKNTSEAVKARLRALVSRLYDTSDQDRVNNWSNRTLTSTLDGLEISESA